MEDHFDVEIRKSNRDEVVALVREIGTINNSAFDQDSLEKWFSKSNRFLAAVCDDSVVGAVSYSTKGIENIKMPVLDFVNVLPSFQRKGIATRLCVSAIDDMVKKGRTRIHCTPLNEGSRRLIESLPFEYWIRLSIA